MWQLQPAAPLGRTEHPTCFVETASAAAFAASAAFAGFAASAAYFAVYFAAAIAGSIAGSAASSASASSETTVAYAVATAAPAQSGALPWALAQQADNTAEDYTPGKSQDLAPSIEKSSKYKVWKIRLSTTMQVADRYRLSEAAQGAPLPSSQPS